MFDGGMNIIKTIPNEKIFGTKGGFVNLFFELFALVWQTFVDKWSISRKNNRIDTKAIASPQNGTDIIGGADIMQNNDKRFHDTMKL